MAQYIGFTGGKIKVTTLQSLGKVTNSLISLESIIGGYGKNSTGLKISEAQLNYPSPSLGFAVSHQNRYKVNSKHRNACTIAYQEVADSLGHSTSDILRPEMSQILMSSNGAPLCK